MRSIWNRIRNEPVLLTGLAAAVLLCLVEFGLTVTPGQQTAIEGVVLAVGVIIARQSVTPNRKLK